MTVPEARGADAGAAGRAAGREPVEPETGSVAPASRTFGLGLSFRVLLTIGFIAVAVVPLALFGIAIMGIGWEEDERAFGGILALSISAAVVLGVVAAYVVVARLTAPLRRITRAVERVAAGESSPPIHLTGDDELARLAESHNRIAADVRRRNAELAALLTAIAAYAPSQGETPLVAQAQLDGRSIFGLLDCQIELGDVRDRKPEEWIPGDPRPVRADVRAGVEDMGLLTGHLPATREWERADQDLLELFANEVGVALRNAELFGRIETQNARLRELDAAKDEFLRGVSHNLQTPLTSIRAYVDQMRASRPDPETDRRLSIVAEQSGRLTRLVRQLLTVTRLEAGALRPEPEVMAIGPRIKRAWEALNASGVALELRDEAKGWLGVADPDELDQVLWALLDNAVKYGGNAGAIEVTIKSDARAGKLKVTIADRGPGISRADRARLFTRFARGSQGSGGEGTGLGLYLSRQLLRGMDGDLWLEPARKGGGAAFTLSLPGESPAGEA